MSEWIAHLPELPISLVVGKIAFGIRNSDRLYPFPRQGTLVMFKFEI